MLGKKHISVLSIIGIGAILGVTKLNTNTIVADSVSTDSNYEIKVNEYNQTYGSNLATTEYGNEPDLILVEADNGKNGYVYKDDFYDTANQPNNPKEALAYMERLEKDGPKTIPVYEHDGKTVIGSFKIGNK